MVTWYPLTSATWKTGDFVAEAKLDKMVFNGNHLRDELAYYHILHEAAWRPQLTGYATEIDNEFEIIIADPDGSNPTSYGTDSGMGASKKADMNISGESEGLRRLVIELTPYTAGSTYSLESNFVKTADADYMSYWAYLDEEDTSAFAGLKRPVIKSISVIVHSTSEGW